MQNLHHLQDSYICFALRWPNILHCHDQTLPVQGGHPNLCTPVNILEAIYKGEISIIVAGYDLELLIKGQRSPTNFVYIPADSFDSNEHVACSVCLRSKEKPSVPKYV